MASNFPVNELNVSFSDEDVSSLFITQSTFRDVDTQEVNEAADFFDNFEMMYLLMIVGMLRKVILYNLVIVPEDWRDHKSVQYFNFSNDVDNGYEVSTHLDPSFRW